MFSVSSKARYIALTVLLPRVGALRLLELGPPLVDELVWAVGARGNVSGHATSFLLQLITAATQEVQLLPAELGPRPAKQLV